MLRDLENVNKKLENIKQIKFEKGDTIYTIKQIREEKVCHVCEGKKTITYNEKEMRCPECMGQGKFTSNKQIHVVLDKPFIISSIKIRLDSNYDPCIRYNGRCGFDSVRRAEENLFSTKEEAQVKCDELNREKIYINVKDIIISDSFYVSQPSIEKVSEKLNYYRDNGKLDKDIVIDKDNILLDGYVNYLICKLLNIETIRAIVEN